MTKFILGFLLIISFNQVAAQCNPPDQLPTPLCEDAPLVCLLNACYQTIYSPNEGPEGWCNGNNTIENPQYFLFYATSNYVEIHIYVNYCAGSALQAAILNHCPWNIGNVLNCNGGTDPGGTIILTYDAMTPGQQYWLMLDGSSGAQCNYTITYTENIYHPLFANDLDGGEAIPFNVCLGADALLVEVYPPIALAHGYYWVPSWSEDTIVSTLSSTTIAVPSDIAPGTYEICASAYSGCDLSSTVCFEVNVFESLIGERDPIILCAEEFPITWGNLTIAEAGEYTRSFSEAGCEFDSLWIIESYPVPDFVIVDTMHCLPLGEFSFYYNNEPFDQPDVYPLFYSKSDVNACDSLAELDLQMIGIDANTAITCNNAQFSITTIIEEVMPFNAEITYKWYLHGTDQLVSETNPFVTSTPGCYDLIVHVETTEFYCEYFLGNHCIEGAEYFPASPVLPFGDTMICRNQLTQFCVLPYSPSEPVSSYVWTAPPNVLISQNGLSCAEMDFSNATGGQVCVQAIGECGGGIPSCFDVTFLPAPLANFSSNSPVCTNDTAVITFTGIASPAATFNWDFGFPQHLSGSGAGPFKVVWSNPGHYSVGLTVIEEGCDTAFYSESISVELLTFPIVNCNTTLNSIEFDWEDVIGTSGYLVSLNGSIAVPVIGSDTIVNMLSPGSSVELILTMVSAGPCPDIVDTVTCIAQNCPTPLIELIGQDSICLNMPSIIDLQALVNGNPGTGTWNGPGITDIHEGLFDPTLSGPGLHTMTYTVMENACMFSKSYTMTVFDSITADFLMHDSICISDATSLTYTGNASANAIYHFDFDSATIQQGTNAGPYLLSWTNGGQKTVTLQIEENACVSDVVTVTIRIADTIAEPIVNCVQSPNGIVFSWDIDPASTGSMFNIISGQPGILTGNTYTVDNLNDGDIVRLEIISQAASPCPERKDSFECVAKDCPNVLLTISPVIDFCLYPDVENVNLEVTVLNGNGSGVWSGPGITDPVAGIFNPHMSGGGTHTIMYQYTDEDCDFMETTTIQVFNEPEAIISNTQLIITCASGSIFLDGSHSSGDSLAYRWTTTDGDIAGVAEESITEITKPGTYQLLVTNSNTGCKDSISVMVDQDSAIPVADAGNDKVIMCDSMQVTLGGNSTTGNSIAYSWETTDGHITGGISGLTTAVDHPGTYTIFVKDTETGCQSSDEVIVEKHNRIEGLVVDQKHISCFGANDASISIVQVIGGTSDYQYDWSVHTNGSTTISSLAAGDYSVTVTDGNDCTFVMEFQISEPDLITIDLGPDRFVQEGDPVSIELATNISGNSIGSINWSNYNGINCAGCTGFDFVAVSDAVISAMIEDTAGCIASDSMQLSVIIPHVRFAPNIFSPNDDGINDFFTISGRSNLTNITSLRIFDRWGNQVFEKFNLLPGISQSGWDGKFNGELMQPGVYLFMAELAYEDILETYSGTITLIR